MACQNTCKRCGTCKHWFGDVDNDTEALCSLLSYENYSQWFRFTDPSSLITHRNFGCVLHEKIPLAQVDPTSERQERDHG